MAINNLDIDRAASTAVYNPVSLLLYDVWVHGVSDRFAWKVSPQRLVDLYSSHISSNHLEIGVGTSLLLNKCKSPGFRRLMLGDLNESALAKSSRRLARYNPETSTVNVFKPFAFEEQFDSVAAHYLFHCVPGHGFKEKALAFDHVHHSLNDGGVFFGSTVVSKGAPKNLFARFLMAGLNKLGVFNNTLDDVDELEAELKKRFSSVQVEISGCVAIFVARK
jgi:hypothetical protein